MITSVVNREEVLHAIRGLLNRARVVPHAELEARLGSIENGHFAPGVDACVFSAIEKRLRVSTHLQRQSHDVDELQDFYYSHGDREARCRTRYDDGVMRLQPTNECIVPIDRLTVALEAPRAIRFSLKTETPMDDVPKKARTNYVRIKQQQRFRYKCFSYDLARTWSGTSKSEAERSQSHDPPRFEVECELLHNEHLDSASDAVLAESFLLKMEQLCSFTPNGGKTRGNQ